MIALSDAADCERITGIRKALYAAQEDVSPAEQMHVGCS